jgi:hypothetical protein
MKKLSTSLSIAMGRARLVYKRYSFPWHGHSPSPGLAARAGEKTWWVYMGKQANGFFPGRSHHSDWPVFGTVGIYDKLQIKLFLIPSSLLASLQARTASKALLLFAAATSRTIPNRSKHMSSPSIDPVLLLSENRRSTQSGMHVGALKAHKPVQAS